MNSPLNDTEPTRDHSVIADYRNHADAEDAVRILAAELGSDNEQKVNYE